MSSPNCTCKFSWKRKHLVASYDRRCYGYIYGIPIQRFTNTNHSGNNGNNSNKTRTKERKPLQEIYIGTIPYASITTDTVQNNNNITILIDDCMKVKNQFVKQKSSSSSKKNNNKKKKASLKSKKTIQKTKANNLRRFR